MGEGDDLPRARGCADYEMDAEPGNPGDGRRPARQATLAAAPAALATGRPTPSPAPSGRPTRAAARGVGAVVSAGRAAAPASAGRRSACAPATLAPGRPKPHIVQPSSRPAPPKVADSTAMPVMNLREVDLRTVPASSTSRPLPGLGGDREGRQQRLPMPPAHGRDVLEEQRLPTRPDHHHRRDDGTPHGRSTRPRPRPARGRPDEFLGLAASRTKRWPGPEDDDDGRASGCRGQRKPALAGPGKPPRDRAYARRISPTQASARPLELAHAGPGPGLADATIQEASR